MQIRSSRKGDKIFFLLEQNAQNVRKAGRLLHALIEGNEGADASASVAEEIAALERFGDDVAEQTAVAVQTARTLPLDRRDLVALTGALDGVVDGIGSAAASMRAYGLGAPSERARAMAEAIAQSCADLHKCVGLMREGPSRRADVLALTASTRARAAAMERENGGLLAPHFAAGQDAETILKWRDVYADLSRTLGETRAAALALESAVAARRRLVRG
ncbi:MAG: DUF47 family protein [Chloroflexota bacterium]|nr:DUF47 family protein [Chloroflexota bacterium]